MRDRKPQRRARFADEGDLHAHVAAHDQRGATDLGDRVQPLLVFLGRRAHRDRIELIEQGLELRFQADHRNLRLRRPRLTQQIDQHRDAAAIAVFHTRRIDQHWHVRRRI